jgi:hypothetical protein
MHGRDKDDLAEKTRRTYRDLLIGVPWTLFATLTFPVRTTEKAANRTFHDWLRDLAKAAGTGPISWYCVHERHASGDRHLHALLAGVPRKQAGTAKALWKGDSKIEPFDVGRRYGAVAYVTKDIVNGAPAMYGGPWFSNPAKRAISLEFDAFEFDVVLRTFEAIDRRWLEEGRASRLFGTMLDMLALSAPRGTLKELVHEWCRAMDPSWEPSRKAVPRGFRPSTGPWTSPGTPTSDGPLAWKFDLVAGEAETAGSPTAQRGHPYQFVSDALRRATAADGRLTRSAAVAVWALDYLVGEMRRDPRHLGRGYADFICDAVRTFRERYFPTAAGPLSRPARPAGRSVRRRPRHRTARQPRYGRRDGSFSGRTSQGTHGAGTYPLDGSLSLPPERLLLSH